MHEFFFCNHSTSYFTDNITQPNGTFILMGLNLLVLKPEMVEEMQITVYNCTEP